MTESIFITGTDTHVGKTVVTAGLLTALSRRNFQVAGIKPVAAGCEKTPEGLRNEDALRLQQASNYPLEYQQVNPVAFEQAIAPHLAAALNNTVLTAEQLVRHCESIAALPLDVLLIEGVGGWRVLLNQNETLAELPKQLNIPVILVVGMRLGCLNHAMLSAEAICRDGLTLLGWVANRIDPGMLCYQENLATLSRIIPAPLLGEIPCLPHPDPDSVADCLDISALDLSIPARSVDQFTVSQPST